MNNFTYKDTAVWFQEYKNEDQPKDLQKTCFCCGNKINNCKVMLLINNHKIIHNMLLHSECFAE